MDLHEQWAKAQVGERSYHCDPDKWWIGREARREREREQRFHYAGMMRLTPNKFVSVTDIGCGPQSLLLDFPTNSVMVAVDPLEFLPGDEALYRLRGIDRFIMPAEEYSGERTDEVWMYNCLQHTINPYGVMHTVTQHAKKTVRVFEWLEVPTDHLHLHSITREQITEPLQREGFTPEHEVDGVLTQPGFLPTKYYGAVWVRNSGG